MSQSAHACVVLSGDPTQSEACAPPRSSEQLALAGRRRQRSKGPTSGYRAFETLVQYAAPPSYSLRSSHSVPAAYDLRTVRPCARWTSRGSVAGMGSLLTLYPYRKQQAEKPQAPAAPSP